MEEFRAPIAYGRCEKIYDGEDILLFAAGSMVPTAETVRNLLSEKYSVGLLNARFAKPFDKTYLREAMKKYRCIVTLEENVRIGGMGEQVTDFLVQEGYQGININVSIPDTFVPHGNVDLLKQKLNMDPASVAERILKEL